MTLSPLIQESIIGYFQVFVKTKMSETINSHPFTEEKEISFKRSSNTISGHFVIVPFGPKWKNQYQMR